MSLAVSLLAVFALVATLGGAAIRLPAVKTSTSRSTAWRAASLSAPGIAGASVCWALVWPGLIQEICHCVAHGLHHPHLCLKHPEYAGLTLAPAGIIAGVWLACVLPQLGRLMAGLWQTQRWVRHISGLREQVFDSVRFRLIDAPGFGAGTVGLFRPLIAVDRGLWRKLDADERRAVLNHEDAHRKRRDPLSLLVLGAGAALTIAPASGKLLDSWRATAESECDRYAAQVTKSPDSVASALIALERYHREQPTSACALAANAGGGQLEGRVRTLLSDDLSARPANLGSDVLAVFLLGLVVVSVSSLLAGDAIHHAAETALGIFVHHH